MRFEIELTRDVVAAFAEATGDFSSLHVDPQFARKTRFRAPIVHGMLPLLLVLHFGVFGEAGNASARLSNLSCRFLRPVKIGEHVTLEANHLRTSDEADIWKITGFCAGADTFLEGDVRLATTAAGSSNESLSREPLVEGRLIESASTIADLKPGAKAELGFASNPGAFQSLFGQVGRKLKRAAEKPGHQMLPMVAMLSTLVGMRLPGRYATLLEFEANFTSSPTMNQMMIEGCVNDIPPARNRMVLGVRWHQHGHEIGSGSASVMVSPVMGDGISCAEIRRSHLQPGLGGRVALITGASRGIGEAIAKLLAMHGARVAVHFFQGKSDAAKIVKDISANDGTAVAVQADLADATAIEQMFRAAEDALGPIDILVNNAVADFTPVPVDRLRVSEFQHEIDITVFGTHHCCRLALPHMRQQGWGKIVNMGTVATEVPVSSQAKYIAAKSALIGYTRALAAETAADNVQVNIVAPAMTETSLVSSLPPALLQRLAEDSPSGLLLQPIDVAEVVVFLCSDWARHISGQRCVVNGGMAPFI